MYSSKLVWFKLLKYNLHKRIIIATKFSNQSCTHNLYWWPLQHAIVSYSTVLTKDLIRDNTCVCILLLKCNIHKWPQNSVIKATHTICTGGHCNTRLFPAPGPLYWQRNLNFFAVVLVSFLHGECGKAKFHLLAASQVPINNNNNKKIQPTYDETTMKPMMKLMILLWRLMFERLLGLKIQI